MPVVQPVAGNVPVIYSPIAANPMTPVTQGEFKIVDPAGNAQAYWMNGAERTPAQAAVIAAGRIATQGSLTGLTTDAYLAALPACLRNAVVP